MFIIFCLGPILASFGQSVSYEAKNKTLSDILDDITREYEVYFSYASSQLADQRTSIQADQIELSDFLKQLLEPFGLQARKSTNQYYFIQRIKQKLVIHVRDQQSMEPLAYASVIIPESQRGDYANIDGRATINFYPDRERLLSVGYFGYKSQQISLGNNTQDTLWVEMEQDEIALEEVAIEYQNDAISLSEGTVFKLKPGTMKILPGLSESDILLSVQMLPGFESDDESASGINVRGGGIEELLVYWDRIPMYQKAHLFGSLTSFIPSAVNEIEAYRNYIPVNYSGATSGLLNIRTQDSIPEFLYGISNSNLKHTDLMLKAPIQEKVGVMLAGRFSYNDILRSPTYNAHLNKLFDGKRVQDVLQNIDSDELEEDIDLKGQVDLSYFDINAKVIFKPSPQDYLSASLIFNENEFMLEAEEGEDVFLAERNHTESFNGLNAFYKRTWNNNLSTTLSISRANYEMSNIDRGTEEQGEPSFQTNIENSLKNTEIKVSSAYTGLPYSVIKTGYQYNDYTNSFDYNQVSLFEDDAFDTLDAQLRTHGAFLMWNFSRGKWEIQPQIRMDMYPRLDETVFNPVVNVQYQLFDDFRLKASWGRYAQALRSLREGDLDVSNVSENVWLLAEDDERPLLRSIQYSLGGVYSAKGLLLDVDLYWKETEGLNALNFLPENLNLDLAFGESVAYGLDLMIRKKFGRYQSWLSYTYSKVENSFEEFNEVSFPSSIDRPHQLRWAHNLYLEPVEISLGWIYRSGAPYSRAIGFDTFEDDADDDDDESFSEIRYESINASRLPDYHRLDMSVWYRFVRKRLNGRIGISIQNVYNRRNLWQRFYFLNDTDDDDEPELVQEDRYFLGFKPNISVQLRFN